jgi:hypothetical protein
LKPVVRFAAAKAFIRTAAGVVGGTTMVDGTEPGVDAGACVARSSPEKSSVHAAIPPLI